MFFNRFLSVGSLLAGLCVSWSAFASVLIPSDAQTQILSSNAFAEDYMYAATPNAAGISINRFSRFEVAGRPLRIIHASSEGAVPNTIVVLASSIDLRSGIEIVGDSADLVLLSENRSGSIQCVNCSFTNMFRVAMLVTKEDKRLSAGSTTIGEINSVDSGSISITNLAAPGVLSLDVVAGSISTAGTINLHERANRHGNGGYEKNINGRYRIGTGQLNIISGQHRWNYESQITEGSALTLSRSQLGGSIHALGVKILAANIPNSSLTIDTRVDLASTVRYRGNVKINKEQIVFSQLRDDQLSLDDEHFLSDGEVLINAFGSLKVGPSATLVANTLSFIAGGSVWHSADTKIGHFHAASASFQNDGHIVAQQAVDIYADTYVVNQYGGRIAGDTIHIETDQNQNSFVLNGSRTPYRQVAAGLLAVDGTYFDKIDHTKLGTYYTTGQHLINNFGAFAQPAQTSAHIYGRNIYVKTHAFENINPYYEIVDTLGEEIVIDRNLLSQVGISAENTLHIDAPRYIVNSSALLGAELPTSQVHLQSHTLVNERYRVLPILDKDYYTETGDFVQKNKWVGGEPLGILDKKTTEIVRTKMATYSPPGVLYSLGSFMFTDIGRTKANPSLFLNSIGYFEVVGEAKFRTARLIDAGIENQEVQKDTSVKNYLFSNARSSASARSFTAHPEEMGSLFYIGGIARAAETDVSSFFNYSPFKGYLTIAVDKIMSTYSFVGTGSRLSSKWAKRVPGTIQSNLSHTINFGENISGQGDSFTISWYEQQEFLVRKCKGRAQNNCKDVPDIRSAKGQDTYSIFDTLANLFNSLRHSFNKILEEVKWW